MVASLTRGPDARHGLDIRRDGRAWRSDEFDARRAHTPERLEIWQGKLLLEDEERVKLLGLLLENLGADRVVRLGRIEVWRDAIADRWLREVKAVDPAYQARLRKWAEEFLKVTVKSDMEQMRIQVEVANPVSARDALSIRCR